MRRALIGPLLAGLLLLPACAEGDAVQRQAVTGADGVQATGRLDGGRKRVAISSGRPDVVLGDCDPGDGLDRDLCMNVRTIDGETLNLVIENPDAFGEGGTLAVRGDACEAEACDAVDGHAVVDLRWSGTQQRATVGTVALQVADDRATGTFELRFDSGDTLGGTFDVPVR